MADDEPIAGEATHNHPAGTISGETCPAGDRGPAVRVALADPMEAWKARGRELNAVYSAIAEAVRTAGIEPTPDKPMDDLVALATLAEQRGEALDRTLAAMERATGLAERYGAAIVAIHGELRIPHLRRGELRRRIRLLIAGLGT